MEIESWFSRNRFLCIFLLLTLIGLLIVGGAYLQKSYEGVVTEVGETLYRPARKSARVRSSATYTVTATVVYTDDDGAERTAEITVTTTNRFRTPRAGERVAVAKTLSGMAAYPNRTIIAVGGTMAVIGGFFLLCILLMRLSERRKNAG